MKRQKLSHAKVLSITKKEYGFNGFNNLRSRNKFYYKFFLTILLKMHIRHF